MPDIVQNKTNRPSHTNVSFYDFFYANKQKKTYTNLIVSIILIIVFTVFALRPTINTIGEIEDKIEEYEKINQQLQTKLSSAQTLSNQVNQSVTNGGSKEAIELVDLVFTDKENLVLVYKNLESRAEEHKVAITSISVKFSDDTEGGVQSEFDNTSFQSPSSKLFSLSLSIESKSIDDLMSFIESLEGYQNNPFFTRIDGFTFNDAERQIEIDKLSEEGSDKEQTAGEGLFTSSFELVFYLSEIATSSETEVETVNQ